MANKVWKAKLLSMLLLISGVAAAQSAQPRKDIPSIARAANGVIVSIITSDKDGHPVAQGSGFLVTKDGRIVTNYHVIKGASSAIVKLPDGAFYAVDGVVAFDKARDLAVIKAHGQNFHVVTLGNSDRVQVGEEVVAIGSPLSLEATVSSGIVSGIRNIQEEGGKFLQVTAPISPGSSGGPLFNMAGEVIGITTLYLKGGENLNFAIPINDAKLLLSTDSKAQDFPVETEAAKSGDPLDGLGTPAGPAEPVAPPTPSVGPATPRAFYSELRDAGGFDRYTDKYVCFFDAADMLRFEIVTTSDDLVDILTRSGDAMDAKTAAEAGQGLYLQNFYKGVANVDRAFYPKVGIQYRLEHEGVIEVYTINWTTGRFIYEVSSQDGTEPVETRTGMCELIHSGDSPSVDKGK
ncbi:MAG: S1C family serine protease [Candidatus Acidiferrales bacterium]